MIQHPKKKRTWKATLQERFDSKWVLDPVTGCHRWIGAITTLSGKKRGGYAVFFFDDRLRRAQLYAYVKKYGSIPADSPLHYTCNLKTCVNAEHWTREESKKKVWKKKVEPQNVASLKMSPEMIQELTQKRFEAKYVVDPRTGCHCWTGATTVTATSKYCYPTFYWNGKVGRAVKYVFEQAHGLLPFGARLYPICNLDLCVNLEHWTNTKDMVEGKREELLVETRYLASQRIASVQKKVEAQDVAPVWEKIPQIKVLGSRYGNLMELKGHIINFKLSSSDVETNHRRYDCVQRNECLTAAAHIENAKRDDTDKGKISPCKVFNVQGENYTAPVELSFSCQRCEAYERR